MLQRRDREGGREHGGEQFPTLANVVQVYCIYMYIHTVRCIYMYMYLHMHIIVLCCRASLSSALSDARYSMRSLPYL